MKRIALPVYAFAALVAPQRTFASRDCPYFKVDVVFTAVSRPSRDSAGNVIQVEADRDVIAKISRPYLQLSISD
jgi:hypothetical protein